MAEQDIIGGRLSQLPVDDINLASIARALWNFRLRIAFQTCRRSTRRGRPSRLGPEATAGQQPTRLLSNRLDSARAPIMLRSSEFGPGHCDLRSAS